MSISIVYPKVGAVLVGVLDRDMRAEGIPIDGLSWSSEASTVRVDYQDVATTEQQNAGGILVEQHIPVDLIQAIQDGAEGAIVVIPGWAHWTEAEANAWGQANIEQPLAQARADLGALATLNLATFKTVIGRLLDILDAMWTLQMALGRMVIAMRNNTWPHLQN